MLVEVREVEGNRKIVLDQRGTAGSGEAGSLRYIGDAVEKRPP